MRPHQLHHPDVFHHGGKNIINEPIGAFSVMLDSLIVTSSNDYEGFQTLPLYQGKRLVQLLDTVHVSLPKITIRDQQDCPTFTDSLTLPECKASIDTLSDGIYTIVPVNVGKKQMQRGLPIGEADVATSLQLTFRTLSMEISNGKMTICCVSQSDLHVSRIKCENACHPRTVQTKCCRLNPYNNLFVLSFLNSFRLSCRSFQVFCQKEMCYLFWSESRQCNNESYFVSIILEKSSVLSCISLSLFFLTHFQDVIFSFSDFFDYFCTKNERISEFVQSDIKRKIKNK